MRNVRMNWEWELRWRSRWNIYVGERAYGGFRGVLRAFCYYALGIWQAKRSCLVGCLHDTHIFFFSIYFVRIAHEYAGSRLPNKIIRKA
jgi:hypothetical protein